MLPEKIEKKVQKHYASHGDTGLLLLAYQVLGAPFAEADDPGPFIEARTLLDELLHPFTQVWYLWLLAGKRAGYAHRIWPA